MAAKHAYSSRQQRVEGVHPTTWCERFVNIHMRALRERVNTRVRTSRSVYAHRPSGDAFERAFQMILNSVAVRLALPAGEWHAVVSHDEFQSFGHCKPRDR